MGSISKKCRSQRRPFCAIVVLVLALCLVLVFVALNSNLPEPQARSFSVEEVEVRLGLLGEAMVAMLPGGLAFTMFVPSEEALEGTLGLRAEPTPSNDTFAILSRLMGFSAVPQHVPSGQVRPGEVLALDSISGYLLRAWKSNTNTPSSSPALVVNNIKSKQVDGKRGEIIVHIMDGVIMDAAFAQSFLR